MGLAPILPFIHSPGDGQRDGPPRRFELGFYAETAPSVRERPGRHRALEPEAGAIDGSGRSSGSDLAGGNFIFIPRIVCHDIFDGFSRKQGRPEGFPCPLVLRTHGQHAPLRTAKEEAPIGAI